MHFCTLLKEKENNKRFPIKLWRITRPAIAFRQKLADSTITRVRAQVKSMVGIRLKIELSTFEMDK